MSGKNTILIVDDNNIDRELVIGLLDDNNINIINACDGLEALTYLRNNNPDLILLDIVMPNLGGFELLEKIQASPLTARIPVILLTSVDDKDYINKGLELGAVDYVIKPFNAKDIKAKIKNHFNVKNSYDTSFELLRSFAQAISGSSAIINEEGIILEKFGSFETQCPNLPHNIKLPTDTSNSKFLNQIILGIKKALKSNATFSFESELTQNGVRKVLQISISDMKYSFNNKKILSLHILDITNKVLENRQIDLLYEFQNRNRLFNNLLSEQYSVKQKNQILETYGLDLNAPVACYIISVLDDKHHLTDIINNALGEWLFINGYAWTWLTTWGISTLVQPVNPASINKNAKLLAEKLLLRFPEYKFKISISLEEDNFNFNQIYADALSSLLFALDNNDNYVLFNFELHAIYQIVLNAFNNTDVDRFIDKMLGKIILSDKQNDGQLLKTLFYILNNASTKIISQKLFIHQNTVLWRKQKIEEILGYNLDDIHIKNQLLLAYKFYRLKNLLSKNVPADYVNM